MDCKDTTIFTGLYTFEKQPKQNKMKTVKLNKQDLINTYNESCSDVKSALKKLYPHVEFEKKLAESWEEYATGHLKHQHNMNYGFLNQGGEMWEPEFNKFWDNHGSITEKYTALRKLELLRDHYNGDWKPDWKENFEYKYMITKYKGKLLNESFTSYSRVLSFKTEKLRDKFLNNFKDLIEQAKDLI